MEDKSAEAPMSSRWNPTKEQISVLEGLYKQGMRTPSAEQIQQITSRLKVHGHIEGKNVFYWFQNHKARQRQKQKQDCMVYINQFLHKAPVFPLNSPAACAPNAVCSPFYVPHSSAMSYYPHQHAKVPLPSTVKRPIIPADTSKSAGAVCFGPSYTEGNMKNSNNCHETLALFPLHPTGILEQGRSSSSLSSTGKSFSSSVVSKNHSISDVTRFSSDDHDHQNGFSSSTKPCNFIDFFAEHTA